MRPSSPPSALTSFRRTCALADLAEVDAPLGVVLVGGGVVVAGVDVLDVLRAWRSGRLASGGNSTRNARGVARGALPLRLAHRAIRSQSSEYLQRNQPDGVPPLPLTGERTLPDVPEENYWYRRHLVVYEWIAGAGRRACAWSTWPAARATAPTCSPAPPPSVVGVDANPEAHEHARLRYPRPNLRFERDLVESFAEPCDAVVFLQTIEHVQDAGAILEHFKSMLGARRRRLRLDAEPADPGAARGARSPTTPGTCSEYRAEEFRALCEAHFRRVEMLGLFHARKLRAHELAIRLGWDRVHKRAAA